MERRRILIVDDEPLMLRALQRLLPKAPESHLDVATAPDVAEALRVTLQAVTEKKPFALIVSDVDLPDGSGFELARKLRIYMKEMPPVWFMSSIFDDWRRAEARELCARLWDKEDLVHLARAITNDSFAARPVTTDGHEFKAGE